MEPAFNSWPRVADRTGHPSLETKTSLG